MCVSRHGASRLVFAAALAAAASVAPAGLINDVSFFASMPTALINFETNGAGNPVTLIQGQTLVLPPTEYAAMGVTLTGTTGPVYWVNDGNAAFDAAQAIGATPNNSIPSSLNNSFTITFSVNVKAFGFFVANNRLVDPNGPVFVARDAGGNILETASFGAPFIDGTISTPNTLADYGFMGIFSSTNIASVTVTKQHALLDDLRFSSVPAPAGASLAFMALSLAARRRRS